MAPRPASRRQPATCSPRLAASRVARMDRNIMRTSSWSRATYCRRSSASCTLRRPSLRVYMLYSCSTSSPDSLGASPGCLDRQESGAVSRQPGHVSAPGRQARAGAAAGRRAPGDVLHVPIAPAVRNEAPEALLGPLMDPAGLRRRTRRGKHAVGCYHRAGRNTHWHTGPALTSAAVAIWCGVVYIRQGQATKESNTCASKQKKSANPRRTCSPRPRRSRGGSTSLPDTHCTPRSRRPP